MITFESLDVGSSFSHLRYIQQIQIKFIYQGHWVKVTGAKKIENTYFHNEKL